MILNSDDKSNRLQWMDIVKGFCIIQMVAFHTQIPYLGAPYLVNITMPCFFLVSGWFFKEKLETLFKSFDKLLIPYVTTAILYNLLNGILTGDFHSLPRSIWFLYVLFGVIVLYYLICKLFNNTIIRDVVCIICLLVGYLMHSEYPYPYHSTYLIDMHYNFEPVKLGSMITMIFLFHLGHRLGGLYKENKIVIFGEKKLINISLIIFISLFIILIIANKGNQFYNVAFNNYETNLWTVVSLWLINILAILMVSVKINNSKLLENYGRYSLVVLCFHIFVLRFSIDHPDHILEYPLDFVLILLLSPLAVLVVKYCVPWLFGLKKSLGGGVL